MEQASNKLRALLDEVKYDAPQSLHADLIAHIADDDPYAFFRYVQSLLSHRHLDALLLSNPDLWLHVRSMYWERFPWLVRSDLKTGAAVPEARERDRRLEKALGRAFRGVLGEEDKEEWITEFLKRNGLGWGDVERGRHLSLEVPGAGYLRLANERDVELDPRAGLYGLDEVVHRGDSEVEGGDETYPEPSAPADTPEERAGSPEEGQSEAPVVLSSDEDSDDSDEEPEFQGAIARMATSLLSPNESPENTRADENPFREATDADPGERMDTTEDNSPVSPSGTSHTQTLLPTPDISPNTSLNPPPAETSAGPSRDAPPKPAEHDDWLANLPKATLNCRASDFQPHPYKGWPIAGPAVTLRRISNFLRDEDVDRTPEWQQKVAEITEYLAYLLVNHDGEKHGWGYELQEAIQLLRAHAAFEDYHYGVPPLKLHFGEGKAKSERLPAVEGFNIKVKPKGKPRADYSVPRNLLHRLPQGIWDTMYGMPRDALYGIFLEELRNDEKIYWTCVRADVVRNRRPAMEWRPTGDRVVPHEYPFGFNMCEVEDDTFISCMEQGPLPTYQELKRTCEFTFKEEDMEVKEKATETAEEEGASAKRNKQLLQFSRFRGANRAALTFSLRTLGSQTREIRAVASPWRRLVVPTAEQRKKKPFPGVIWRPARLSDDDVPKEGIDPMAYNFWHNMLLESQGSWAKAKVADVEKARGEGAGPPVPRTNFKGPFEAVEVSAERHADEEFLKQLKRTWRDLETAARLYPRPAIKEVLIYLKWGLQGLPPAREEEGMFPADTIDHKHSKREVLPLKPGNNDLELLERMAHRSVNEMMLKLVPKEWSVRKRVFADRVQGLVADISASSIFATAEVGVTLGEVVAAVNVDVGGPVKRARFTEEEAFGHLADLETFKRISVTRTHTDKEVETTYSRPKTDIHPEHTFHWNQDIRDETRPRQPPTYLSYEYLPKLNPSIRDLNLQRTLPLLKGTAWRVGKTIRGLERALRAQKPLTAKEKAAFRQRHRELTREWERSVEAQRDSKGQRQAMGYTDVVRYADPSRFKPEWAADDAPDDPEAQAAVRAGALREAHSNKTMLWPARWRRVKDKTTGEGRVVWDRDGVWGWARPDVRKSWRYFHMNRWPVHLQTEKWKAEVKRASELPMPICVMGGVKRGVVVGEEERLRGRMGALERELGAAKLGKKTKISLAGLGEFE